MIKRKLDNYYNIGSNIYLKNATIKDAKGNWYSWLNDKETTKFLGGAFWPNTKEKQIEFVKRALNNNDRIIFSIYLKKKNIHIGQCSLSEINWIHRFAETGMIIGEKKYRKGVYAMEAFKLLLELGFEKLNLENIKSSVINPTAKKLHKLMGFKKAGSFKDLYLIEGKKMSMDLFYINKKIWKKIYNK